jgi:hypothetical protein
MNTDQLKDAICLAKGILAEAQVSIDHAFPLPPDSRYEPLECRECTLARAVLELSDRLGEKEAERFDRNFVETQRDQP